MKKLFLLCLLLVSSLAASQSENPAELMRVSAGELFNELNSNRDCYMEDKDSLRQLVRDDLLSNFDLDYAARLILGPASRKASPEQITAFGQAMTNVLVDRYAEGLLRFESKEQLEVLPLKGEAKPRLTRVQTRIRLDNGRTVPIDYSFRQTDDGWKAFDVTVEGVSYIATFRNQIVPQVRKEGLDTVIAKLESGSLELDDKQN